MPRLGTLGLLVLVPAVVLAQGTSEDYDRAAKLYWKTKDKIFRTSVTPHWLEEGKRFWYRNDLADKAKEWVLVDTATGKRQLAFDHGKLASHLEKKLGKSVKPTHLPLEDFSVKGDEIHFKSAHKTWIYLSSEDSLQEKKENEPEFAAMQKRPRPKQRNSPKSPDGQYSALVKDYNIYLREEKSGKEFALSTDGKSGDGYGGEFYWSADSRRLIGIRIKAGSDRKMLLLESSPRDSLTPRLHSIPYLKPGDEVTQRKPRLFNVETKKEMAIKEDLFSNPYEMHGFRWDPDGKRFYFVYNQRGHQVLRVVALDVESGKCSALVDEVSKTFVCYSSKQFLHWLPQTNELIWMSERDGYNHLYLYDTKSGTVKNQITKGDWVVRGVERVDEKTRQVWFRCSGYYDKQDPYYVHFARVGFDGSGLVMLTEGDGTHQIRNSPDGKHLIDSYSRVDMPGITELRRVEDGKLVCKLEKADASRLEATGWKPPERFVAKGRDGKTDIYGIIIRPSNFDPRKKYPVIEDIYAGPHDSFVPKSFRPYYHSQTIGELGFIVVKMDGMGTSNRSKAFHDVCWKNLGDSGFPDRIAWIRAAAKKYPEMDISRVGIYGGSAGGQSSTRAMLAHGDFYKVAVSDCGCHDNRVDKIWWNEQWMGWPVEKHYREQSNATNAKNLTGKLLLIVGEMDRNVDPASTMQVVDALIKANKDFDMLVIPGAGHGAAESTYGQRRRQDYFVRRLLGVEPRRKN